MNNFELITKIILEKLEQGVIPWQRPFQGYHVPNANFRTKKPYRGINALITSCMGYKSPYWLTYKQVKDLGGTLKDAKGKGVPIVFGKTVQYEDSDGNVKQSNVFKRSYVFNMEHVEGIDCPYLTEGIFETIDFNPIEACEEALVQMNDKIPGIEHFEQYRAYYSPSEDVIRLSHKENFISEEEYYGTLFHEIIHSTGHKDRLKRDMTGGKASKQYAMEELIAEIGSSFLCGMTGIMTKTIDNSATYIKGWMERISDDNQLIISASSKAQKAVDYLKINVNEEILEYGTEDL